MLAEPAILLRVMVMTVVMVMMKTMMLMALALAAMIKVMVVVQELWQRCREEQEDLQREAVHPCQAPCKYHTLASSSKL